MPRLAQLSDIHLTTPQWEWRREDWFNKRLAAWFNYRCLGRGFRFRHADQVLEATLRDIAARNVDHLLFSGDCTALGFESEIAKAAHLLGVGAKPGLAVPGNHDYCTVPAAASGNFERHFAAWQQGERIGDAVYPFAQKVGPAWFVAVNSSTGNRWAWDAGGSVGPDQRERLRQLLDKLSPGPRVLVTHYPVCLANGKREEITHGLHDVHEVVAVAEKGGVKLWLHGHRHHWYFLPKPSMASFPVLCVGSSTQTNLWSYFDYDLGDRSIKAQRRVYQEGAGQFQDAEKLEIAW